MIKYRDPTKTKTLRDKFVREVNRRFRELRAAIRVAIEDEDCLGLLPEQSDSLIQLRGLKLQTPGKRAFAFNTSAEKLEAFMEWLRVEQDLGILETVPKYGPAMEVVGNSAWSDLYITSAYKKGILRSQTELKKFSDTWFQAEPISMAFNRPIHADAVGLLYTRSFNELKGISDAMDQIISRSLAESLAEGRNPYQTARILMSRVEKEGLDLSFSDSAGRGVDAITRARMFARTETIRAFHVATINSYREAGVKGVKVQAEWLTAEDSAVCELCLELSQGGDLRPGVYTLDAIEGLIPAHPNCRCCAIPADIHLDDENRPAASYVDDEG